MTYTIVFYFSDTRLPPGRQCNCTKLETPFGPNFCPPSGLCRNSDIRNAPSSGAIWYSNSESDDDDENDIINDNRESVKTDNHKLNYWQSYRQNGKKLFQNILLLSNQNISIFECNS